MDPLQPQLENLSYAKKNRTLCFFRHPKLLVVGALRPLAYVLVPAT